MEDHFRIVKTWRGYILVSSCLLPSSGAERARIYPDPFVNNSNTATARDSTEIPLNNVAQDTSRRLPGPNSGHHGATAARDFRPDRSCLCTSIQSHLSAPSEYNDMSTITDELVRSPDSIQMATPALHPNSQDWEHGSPMSSEEPTSSDSRAPFPTAIQPAPVPPLDNKEYRPKQAKLEASPVSPEFRPRLPEAPRVQVRTKRSLSNDGSAAPDADYNRVNSLAQP